ncbi:MAG: TonB-dependent receptor [Treponema sp.]|nr:TonB-dependent receptor [Treponema sp.]
MLSVLLSLILILLLPMGVSAQEEFDYYDDNEFYDEFYYFDDEASLTVVGTRQTSQQISIIGREEIQSQGTIDLASLLQQTLSINIARYGPYGSPASIHLRGYSSRRIAFLIDGIPVNSSIDSRFDISQIDLNSIERIEVIYGGSDSTFNVSGALGGVINIITLGRQAPGWDVSGVFSNTSLRPGAFQGQDDEKNDPRWADLLDSQSLSFSASYGSEAGAGFSFRGTLFANRAANHFIYKDHLNTVRRKENNEIWDGGLNASFIWNIGEYSSIIASSNLYYGDRNVPISGFSNIYGIQGDFSGRQSIMLQAPRAFHDDLAIEAALSWNFARTNYTSPADVFSRHDQNSINLINRWAWYPSSALILRSGIDYRYISLDSTEIGNRGRHDGGLHLTAEYRPVREVQIIPSVKAVFTNRDIEDITLIPKLGLLWNLSDSLLLKSNVFRSFKFPDFEELYWTGAGGYGNPDLRAEDGWGADIGLVLDKGLFMFETTGFSQLMQDSIHWFYGSGGTFRPENVGQALFFGLDNSLQFNIPLSIGPIREMSPSLTYKYLRSYLLAFGYDFTSNKRIPYNPEHSIGLSINVSWITGSAARGSLLISGHFESVRYHDRANLTGLEPYLLLNAAVNQELSERLSFFASLNNILNTSYESFYAYPMPGISLTLGLRAVYR